MLSLLIRKQLYEVFKGYFYNSRKNQKRSLAGKIFYFALFAVIMIGLLGGMFTALASSLCRPFADAGVSWLYFALMSGIAVLLGMFGSVFNTYQGLYLGKDNDLLLSMPIPVKDIIISRLVNVWIMGVMYSWVVILPALIVYWIKVDARTGVVLSGILLMILISMIVLILSCLLGWAVARISQKLKRKSLVTVLASLAFIGAYYFFYFKASSLIGDMILNAAVFGARIKGAAYGVYVFGSVAAGSGSAAAVCTGVIAALSAITWLLLSKSFLSIATSSGNTAGSRIKAGRIRQKNVFSALLGREFARFLSSPNYMLNCGLGILFMPALGVFLLIKGSAYITLAEVMLGDQASFFPVAAAAALCLLACMVDPAAPSVSLEGKNIWIAQSMPVENRSVLRAKTCMQLILSGIPMLFTLACVCAVLRDGFAVKLLICLASIAFCLFLAVFSTFASVRFVNLKWTNEIIPIKQSMSTFLSLFGGWIIAAAFGGLYFVFGKNLGAKAYLGIWILIFLSAAALLLRWLDTKGARRFAEL